MTPSDMTPLEMAVWANVYSSRFNHHNAKDAVSLANAAVEHMRKSAPNTLASAFGKWPGNETDEQLIAAAEVNVAPGVELPERIQTAGVLPPAYEVAPEPKRHGRRR